MHRGHTCDRGARLEHVLVPVADEADGGTYRVMVPLSNPEHEKDLITLACTIAKQRDGTVDAVHIVTVPDQTSLEYAADHLDEFQAGYHDVLDAAERDAETYGIELETHTIVSHRSFEEIFDAARTLDADLVVMGWGDDSHGSPGRVESALDDLVRDLPADFLVLKDRGFDPEHVLVPTAGGVDSELSAEVAKLLREEYGSKLTLLHVDDDREVGQRFLESWAEAHGLEDAELRVDAGPVDDAIVEAATEATMIIAGASERGLLSRLLRGTPVLSVVDEVDCSVLLAERSHHRGFIERLLGR